MWKAKKYPDVWQGQHRALEVQQALISHLLRSGLFFPVSKAPEPSGSGAFCVVANWKELCLGRGQFPAERTGGLPHEGQMDADAESMVRFLCLEEPAVILEDPPAGVKADVGALDGVPGGGDGVGDGEDHLVVLAAVGHLHRAGGIGVLQDVGVEIVKGPVEQVHVDLHPAVQGAEVCPHLKALAFQGEDVLPPDLLEELVGLQHFQVGLLPLGGVDQEILKELVGHGLDAQGLFQALGHKVPALVLAVILPPVQQFQVGQQGGQGGTQVVGHGRDQLGVGGTHLLLRPLVGQDGAAHLVDAGGQVAQLIPAFHCHLVAQVAPGQDVQLAFQAGDVAQLAVDDGDKAHGEDSHGNKHGEHNDPIKIGVPGVEVQEGLGDCAVLEDKGVLALRVLLGKDKQLRVQDRRRDRRFIQGPAVQVEAEINLLLSPAPGVEQVEVVLADPFPVHVLLQLHKGLPLRLPGEGLAIHGVLQHPGADEKAGHEGQRRQQQGQQRPAEELAAQAPIAKEPTQSGTPSPKRCGWFGSSGDRPPACGGCYGCGP